MSEARVVDRQARQRQPLPVAVADGEILQGQIALFGDESLFFAERDLSRQIDDALQRCGQIFGQIRTALLQRKARQPGGDLCGRFGDGEGSFGGQAGFSVHVQGQVVFCGLAGPVGRIFDVQRDFRHVGLESSRGKLIPEMDAAVFQRQRCDGKLRFRGLIRWVRVPGRGNRRRFCGGGGRRDGVCGRGLIRRGHRLFSLSGTEQFLEHPFGLAVSVDEQLRAFQHNGLDGKQACHRFHLGDFDLQRGKPKQRLSRRKIQAEGIQPHKALYIEFGLAVLRLPVLKLGVEGQFARGQLRRQDLRHIRRQLRQSQFLEGNMDRRIQVFAEGFDTALQREGRVVDNRGYAGLCLQLGFGRQAAQPGEGDLQVAHAVFPPPRNRPVVQVERSVSQVKIVQNQREETGGFRFRLPLLLAFHDVREIEPVGSGPDDPQRRRVDRNLGEHQRATVYRCRTDRHAEGPDGQKRTAALFLDGKAPDGGRQRQRVEGDLFDPGFPPRRLLQDPDGLVSDDDRQNRGDQDGQDGQGADGDQRDFLPATHRCLDEPGAAKTNPDGGMRAIKIWIFIGTPLRLGSNPNRA